MDDAGTILGGDKVSCHHPQSPLIGLDPGKELLVSQPYEVRPLISGNDAVGHHLAPLLGGLHRQLLALRAEIGREARLRQHDGDRLEGVGVKCLHSHIVDPAANGESHIGGKGPRRGGPGGEVGGPVSLKLLSGIDDLHESSAGGVLHVPIGTRLTQLVGAKSGASGGRVGLYGISLVEQVLLEELLQEIPQCLYVAIVVGDVGVIQVHPVAHLRRELAPLGGVLHHLLAARFIVLIDRDLGADVGLGDAELLLHTDLYRQSVGVPPCLAVDEEALHRLVAADNILDRASHDVVDPRHTIG